MTTVAVLTLVKILKNHTCACVLIICTWKPTTKLAQASTTVLVAHVNSALLLTDSLATSTSAVKTTEDVLKFASSELEAGVFVNSDGSV